LRSPPKLTSVHHSTLHGPSDALAEYAVTSPALLTGPSDIVALSRVFSDSIMSDSHLSPAYHCKRQGPHDRSRKASSKSVRACLSLLLSSSCLRFPTTQESGSVASSQAATAAAVSGESPSDSATNGQHRDLPTTIAAMLLWRRQRQ